MIFTWGVELLVFWLLFLALYASGSYDRCLSLTGVVSSGLALVAHVAISAWDPRDLSGAEEGGEAKAEGESKRDETALAAAGDAGRHAVLHLARLQRFPHPRARAAGQVPSA